MKNLVFVFALLLTLVCCTTEADRDRMHAGLDSINQRNRNDQPFTVADVEPYVRFFDDHGTPNDRLLAYYLLGRAYHDHGEGMLSILGYDKMGFVAKKSEIGLGRQMSISDYINNTLGEVTQENFRKYKPATNGTMECIASGTIQNNYIYLHTNLLTSSVISITDKNGSMRTDTIQNLTYDNFGHVMTNDRGGTVADMTYGYDLMHGWLKSIRSGGRFEQNLYRESEGSTPCFNGNISAMTWRTGNDYVRRFDYEYNEMNWLSQATFSYYSIGNPNSPSPTLSLIPYVGIDHEDYTSEYSYDKNGNLTAAYRQGLVGDLYDEDEYCVYDTMDDYNVEYYGNQRRSVNGSGPGTPSYYGSSSFVDGVEDGDDEYAYNANGAMTMDLNKGITNISYDLLNNIRQVTFSGNRNIVYTYAADGTRLRAVHSRKVGNTWLKDSTDYCGSLILQNGAPSMYQFAGGYISFSNSALSGCHYYIQDYLGNNRMVVNKTDAVEQTTHYYPYGGVIGGIALNSGFQKYKFGGKELDRSYGLDWYDVQARQYDPVVPSWHTVDPLAEKYYYISPYAYCENNPVNAIDPNGMDWLQARGDSVFWYGGELNDKSELKYTFASTSGYAKYNENGDVLESYQKAEYQFLENTGPTPEGVYEINLEPSPTRHAKIIGDQYIPNNLGGIEMTDYEENGIRYTSSAWGRFRARLTPISVNKNIKRNIKSFYLHDSTKGYTHGCIEVDSLLFDLLINYRENNSSIKVKVQYPSLNHITNGGTKRK